MRIRARFPNGGSHVVDGLTDGCSYAELVSLISAASGRGDVMDARIFRAGAPGTPSEKIAIGPGGACMPALQTGDSLRVEPAATTIAAAARGGRGGRRGRGGTRARARGGAAVEGTIRTLRDVRRPPPRRRAERPIDYDDPRDTTYDPDADAEPAVQRPKRPRRGRARGVILGDGTSPSRREPPRKRAPSSNVMLPGEATANMGAAIASAAAGGAGTAAQAFRASLSSALIDRQNEVLGERRFAASLSRTYEFIPFAGGAGFKVRFRARGDRAWTDDGMHPAYSRELVAAVLKSIVEDESEDGKEIREKLKPLEMAIKTHRMFWNIVRLFPECGVEEAIPELLPGVDLGFLATRRRKLSAKAKRNLENARVNLDEE